MTPAILRGTAIGSLLGILPGAGMSIASFFSYSLERKVSRFRDMMGKGAIEGVAAPESANNAAAQTAFIPTLTLGIPGSADHGADARRDDHAQHPAGPAGDEPAIPSCSGA